MKHTSLAPTPTETSPDGGVAEILGGVAVAAAGSGGTGLRRLGRQARLHPKMSCIVLLMMVSAVLGWRWRNRSSAPAERRVELLDAA